MASPLYSHPLDRIHRLPESGRVVNPDEHAIYIEGYFQNIPRSAAKSETIATIALTQRVQQTGFSGHWADRR